MRHLGRSAATLLPFGTVLLALLGSPATLEAQRVEPARSTAGVPGAAPHALAIEEARGLIHALMERQGIPGLSVAVGVDGEIAWSEGFGLADLENRIAVTPLTRMRVGSISKPMAAAAVGLLYERGRLDLDAEVQRYVPTFPRKDHPITTRQLTGHLSGIRHYRYDNPAYPKGNEFHSRDHYDSVEESLEIFRNDPLLFEPGTRYSYSSYAWNLVSAVVESAAGEDFLEFMHRNVFEPIGMRRTLADHADSIIADRTRFYEWGDCAAEYCTQAGGGQRRLVNGPYTDLSSKWAGGGFLSTPEDLVRFGFAHLGPGFLKDETRALLFTSQKTTAGETTGYGIGWQVGVDERGHRTFRHGGGSVGGTSMLILYPEQRVVVAMQANLTDAGLGSVPEEIAHRFIATATRPSR